MQKYTPPTARPASPDVDIYAPYEGAARIYCRNTGMDPDVLVPVPHPVIVDATDMVPAWRLAARSLMDLSEMLVALKQAALQKAANDGKPATEH